METLYFGYGSNLNDGNRAAFCGSMGCDPGSLLPVRKAWLPDEALVFDYYSRSWGGGALNLGRKPGCLVDGMLFSVTEEGWEALDAKEGHPDFYRREEVFVIDGQGREIKAMTYRVAPGMTTGFVPPTEEYLRTCKSGREDYELDTAGLVRAAAGEPAIGLNAVFVYGTLLRGEPRESLWADRGVASVLPAAIERRLWDQGEYPALEMGPPGRVKGDLIEFDDVRSVLDAFDAVEGFGDFGHPENLFRRTLVEADVGGGRRILAWTYVGLKGSGPLISHGDWRRHRASGHRAVDGAG